MAIAIVVTTLANALIVTKQVFTKHEDLRNGRIVYAFPSGWRLLKHLL